MSNNWFQFKQFKVHQDAAAMKVGTDGVLLGAWIDVGIKDYDNTRFLDVGTGTGLIALMIAQRCSGKISAIEIDEAASTQAGENFRNSKWANRLNLINGDFTAVERLNLKNFDHVVCNPPFFKASLNSRDNRRNLARHDNALPLSAFIDSSQSIIKASGKLSLILPHERFEQAMQIFEQKGFFLLRMLTVRSRQEGQAIRVLSEWGLEKRDQKVDEIAIYCESTNQYTDEFRELTKAFYLFF